MLQLPSDLEAPGSEDRVAEALELAAGLLGRPEVLAHPTAAGQLVDALLQLASTLQRAELLAGHAGAGGESRASTSRALPPASLVLQQLQAATAAPPAPPSPALEGLVRRMGFRAADLRSAQAQLAQRTAAGLQQQGSWSGAASPGPSIQEAAAGAPATRPVAAPQPPLALDAVDQLLVLAAGLPPYQPCGGGRLGSLHALVAGGLLPLLRQRPLRELPLSSPGGWASYFMLEPRALQQCLAEILQGCLAPRQLPQQQGSGPPPLADLIAREPHWRAAVAAAAAHPALHLVARQTLHAWLAESGSLAVWELLVALRQAAAAAGSGADSADPGAERATEGAALLPALRVLHPAGPARDLAALLHVAPPSASGLVQAAALVQKTGAAAAAQASGLVNTAGAAAMAGNAESAGQVEGVWEALLDHPRWLCYALRLLPLQRVLAAADAEAGGDCGPACEASPGTSGLEQAREAMLQKAASVLVSWAVWPHDGRRREALQRALQGQTRELDLAAVRPWLAALQGWLDFWLPLLEQQQGE